MLKPNSNASELTPQLLGDWRRLSEELGSTDSLATLTTASTSLSVGRIDSLSKLQSFLNDYRSRMLVPVELPAIYQAFHYARRYEVRELIALDQQLARQPLLQDFAIASQRVGQGQLKRLRPMRDQRFVRRYLHAVETGEAHGWHTLVYGLVLSLYSLPICQGLTFYSQQTLRGFIQAASPMLQLSEQQCQSFHEELLLELARPIRDLLNSSNGRQPRVPLIEVV